MHLLSLWLAKRFLYTQRHEKTVSFMVMICFISIFIGATALTLVAAIMNGFEYETHKKLQGIHADLIIRTTHGTLNYAALKETVLTEYGAYIAALTPYAYHTVMIQPADEAKTAHIVILTGIDPTSDPHVSSLNSFRTTSSIPLNELLHHNHLLIGTPLALQLGVTIASPLRLFYTPTLDEEAGISADMTLETAHALIADTFKTGIDEWDTALIFCSLSDFMQLFPDAGITSVGIKLKKQLGATSEKNLLNALTKRLGSSLEVISWKDLYPALVSALMLQKYALFSILALITLVAGMNIISLLFMYITHKKKDIAILLTLGMPLSTITTAFMLIGILIALLAGMCGIVSAIIISWLLHQYPLIQLPDIYYVSHLPAQMSWEIVVAVILTVFFISLVASWIPARRLAHQSLIQLLTDD